MVGYFKDTPKEDKVLLKEIAKAPILDHEGSTTAQRNADHKYYLARAREAVQRITPECKDKRYEGNAGYYYGLDVMKQAALKALGGSDV